jgi:hypothetical protein
MKIEIELSGNSGLQWTVSDPSNSELLGRPVEQGDAKNLADAASAAAAAVRNYLRKRSDQMTAEAAVWG